jgi:hypothetical protein
MKNVLFFLAFVTVFYFALPAIAADKVVVIPLNTKTIIASTPVVDGKLWGQGRVDAGVSNIEYHSSKGIDYAISNDAVSWGATHAACPANWWVCRESDLLGVAPSFDYTRRLHGAVRCEGTAFASSRFWLAESADGYDGKQAYFSEVDGMGTEAKMKCYTEAVLCCRLHKLIIIP